MDEMLPRPTEKASADWAIGSRRVITPEGERHAAIVVRGETIIDVVPFDRAPSGIPIHDFGDCVLLPGLVDAHVHVNEPGRTEWEGFATATSAAAAGGITTLVDMPLNSSPVTTTAESFQKKFEAAQGKLHVDVGFYGGIVPGNANDIPALIEAGVLGFKAFLCHSGIDEFPAATAEDLRAAAPILAAAGLPLLAHAELVEPLSGDIENHFTRNPQSYLAYLATRPRSWEQKAIEHLIHLCSDTRVSTHIVHLASADALPAIAKARASGLPLTVETCPHYLFFAAEEIPNGQTRYKCAPPLRERENRERLWQGLRDGLIDTIGSDHSPAPPEMKCLDTGDLRKAWGGIASLQLGLSTIWALAQDRDFTLVDIVRWMSRDPAELVGLSHRKGSLAPGFDADIVVFDPDASWLVQGDKLLHRHKITPYDGHVLAGRVQATYLRGQKIFGDTGVSPTPTGKVLLRSKGVRCST